MRTAEGKLCGRIRDAYFDDAAWKVTHLVLSIEPSLAGRRQHLIEPSQIVAVRDEEGFIDLSVSETGLAELPPAGSLLPVCMQYAAFSSAGARKHGVISKANPHLRSAKRVINYELEILGERSGKLVDFLYDSASWEIRYLGIEQEFSGKKLRFYLLPQSVERITLATQRVLLRELEPVALSLGAGQSRFAAQVAA